MESLTFSFVPSLKLKCRLDRTKKLTFLGFNQTPSSSFSLVQRRTKPTFKTFISSSTTTETANPREAETQTTQDENFDWYAHWYPLMPICDLDKRVPHAKRVLGIDVVVWWEKNENAWKVFDDACPHRLAPLSEERIDQWGRLQCVYHGWYFNGSGDCKFIPQAPTDGPPVVSFSLLGVVATIRQGVLASGVTRTATVVTSLLCIGASKWLAHFIHQNFHFQDCN